MPGSAWLACLLSLAWAVAGLNHQDGSRPRPAATTARSQPPVADGQSTLRDKERLAHLRQAEAHLRAADLEGLIPVLEEAVRHEILLDQLADKVDQLRELQRDIARLREQVSSSPAEFPVAEPQQIRVQLQILEIPRGKLVR